MSDALAIRALSLDDAPAVADICRDVYHGLDQTPILFAKLLAKAAATHAIVDAVSGELLGFQMIDLMDGGACAWFHSLRVRQSARRRGVASRLQRHQFAFVRNEMRIACVRYSTNGIDEIPRAFAVKNSMQMVHETRAIFDLDDARACAHVDAEVAMLGDDADRVVPAASDSDIAHLVETCLLGNEVIE